MMEKKRSNTALQPIQIPQLLQIPERRVTLPVQDYFPDLETLTPIQGLVEVAHKGNYLDVSTQAKAIVTLSCDRCLCQYNHRIELETQEIIWLDAQVDEAPEALEQEVEMDDLIESLHPQGTFDPAQWLYEQLCLAIPLQKRCDPNCEGIALDDAQSGHALDSRWSILAQLKTQINEA